MNINNSEQYIFEKLKEIGFGIQFKQKGRGMVSWKGYGIGIYDSDKNSPLQIEMNPQYSDDSIEEIIDAAEILKKNKIPYTLLNLDKNIKVKEEEIFRKNNLLGRLKKLQKQ